MSKQRRWVDVGGWQYSRELIEDEQAGKVKFEVAVAHNHCPTCADRIRYVSQQVSQKNLQYSWEYPGGSKSFIVLDHPGAGVSINQYLSEALGLRIN
jgi:hypothetical protein